jgi:hypothetical protein
MAIADEGRRTPQRLWPHLLCAVFLSLLVPGWGGRYLFSSSKTSGIGTLTSAGCAVAILFFVAQDYNLNLLILCVIGWSANGMWCGFQECRLALACPRDLRIAPLNFNAQLIASLIWIPTVLLLMAQGRAPTSFFSASNDTPLVRAGDILYGIDYGKSWIEVARGQLLLASIDSKPSLVRVIGIPGDIVTIGSYAINVNAITIHIGASPERDRSDARAYLSGVASALAYPGNRRRDEDISRDLNVLLSKDTVVVGLSSYLIAQDQDILAPRTARLPTAIVNANKVIAVPWAKLGFLQGMPGSSSGIAQPQIVQEP